MKKQILAGILSATMVVGMGGVSVFAADKEISRQKCFGGSEMDNSNMCGIKFFN